VGLYYAKAHKVAQISIKAKIMPKPGILATFARTLANAGIRIVALNFTSENDRRYIAAFIDLSHAKEPLSKVIRTIKSFDFVEEVKVASPIVEGLIVDQHSYPITMLGGRVQAMILPRRLLSGVFAGLRRDIGPPAWALAYNEGLLLGEELAKSLKKMLEASPREYLKIMAKFYTALGWGRVTDADFDTRSRRGYVEIEDNFEVEAYGTWGEPVCHYTRGVIAGVVTEIVGGHFLVTETHCRAKGDSRCKFIIRYLT